eukprot:GHVU01171976.1.p1 GENE.GHVU01171976.1~~GHVU01171976.1.p1  ORF type:complete len:149 (-),score=18.17 GHVU01171976.1:644-1090(-)
MHNKNEMATGAQKAGKPLDVNEIRKEAMVDHRTKLAEYDKRLKSKPPDDTQRADIQTKKIEVLLKDMRNEGGSAVAIALQRLYSEHLLNNLPSAENSPTDAAMVEHLDNQNRGKMGRTYASLLEEDVFFFDLIRTERRSVLTSLTERL